MRDLARRQHRELLSAGIEGHRLLDRGGTWALLGQQFLYPFLSCNTGHLTLTCLAHPQKPCYLGEQHCEPYKASFLVVLLDLGSELLVA